MKTKNIGLVLGIFTALLWFSCTQNAVSNQEPPEHPKQFDWLVGNWQRTNDAEGKETYEQWQSLSATQYQGLGFTLEAGDTVFKEDLLLVQREGNWYFEVRGVNEKATIFPLTQMDSISFQCENPENEFPKIIHYSREGAGLKAVISADDFELPFYFEAIEAN